MSISDGHQLLIFMHPRVSIRLTLQRKADMKREQKRDQLQAKRGLLQEGTASDGTGATAAQGEVTESCCFDHITLIKLT